MSHAQDITFNFYANYECAPFKLDSVLIENLTNKTSAKTYYPNNTYTFIITSNNEIQNGNKSLKISQNYPNPFNDQTKFDVEVYNYDEYLVEVYDLQGRNLTSKICMLDTGIHNFTFYGGLQNIYLLSVRSTKEQGRIKMLQKGSGNGSAPLIQYNGSSSTSAPANNHSQVKTKSLSILQYQTGDLMKFTGYITKPEKKTESQIITETSFTNKDILFDFAGFLPDKPVFSAGPEKVMPGQTNIEYSVNNLSGISWEWEVPNGWVIKSGQGSHIIKVDAGQNGGNISVVAINNCGSSATAIRAVKIESDKEPDNPPMAAFYVSPSGRAGAKGSLADPLDLQTAINSGSPARPGDLVILLEGTYKGRFTSKVRGTRGKAIVFMGEPGKRVTIDGSSGSGTYVLTIEGEWVEFRNLEITNNINNRMQMVSGVEFLASNSKLVNTVVHNNAAGIAFWQGAENSELYGNIIYNNGYFQERGRGHAIYSQNKNGTKIIANNILFFGYGYGIHAYTENGNLEGFDIENNVWFRVGASMEGSSLEGNYEGMLIGGHQPVDRTRVIGNHSWSPVTNARNVLLGWSGTIGPNGTETLWNEFISLKDNYFVGDVAPRGYWKSAEVVNNSFYSVINPPSSEYPNNNFSTFLPTGTKIVSQKNNYDPDRIDLIIYNWNNTNQVNVNLSGLLENGKSYKIYSVFNLWGEAVASGVYNGGSVAIPMGTVAPPQPNGFPNAITGSDNPGKTFGVFVLRAN